MACADPQILVKRQVVLITRGPLFPHFALLGTMQLNPSD